MKKYLSVILSICLLLPLFNVVNAEEATLTSAGENSEFIDFVASDLYVRSGTDGEKVKDWYTLYQNGFMVDKTVFMDRDYSFAEMPEEFVNQCYIQTRKGDTYNNFFVNNTTSDWLTFNINKSATVYVIDYMINDVLPMWLEENGWESKADNSVKYKYVTLTRTNIFSSTYIHKKHYDVNPGETVTVEIGGYEGRCYDTYTVVVIPDEKKPERVVAFSESELSVPNWENEVAKPSKDYITMFKGSNKVFKYGVKENIDVRPVKKDNKYFLPVTYFANVFGGKVEGNILTYNGNTYDLSTNGVSENGNYLMEGNELCKIFGKKLTTTDDGLIFVGNSELNILAEDLKRILSLYFVNLVNVELRTKYAQPGDELIIPDGEYVGAFMKINGKGTEEKNIIVRSETPGGVRFTGDTTIIISGEYVHFKDFYFDKVETSKRNIYVTNAKYCRISDCYFYYCAYSDDGPNYYVIYLGENSKYCRVDHNTFERSNGVCIGTFVDDDSPPESLSQYHRVDHNYFKDIRLCTDEFPYQSNGRECLMVGSAMIKGRSGFLTCEYNLFEDTYGDGNEIITNKSSDNVYRYNTWFQTRGLSSAISTRQGDNVVWDRNYLINATNGIVSTGHNTKITNNYFYNVDEGAASARIANFNKIERHYKQNVNLLIANNIIIDPRVSGIELGRMYLTLNDSYTYKPRHTKIYNNVVYKMSRDGYFVNDVVSEGTKYKNNITNIEETDIEGVEVRNDKLVLKKGLFYVPEKLSELEGKGFYDPDVNLFDEYGNQDGTLDVGIDNFTDEVIEQTYMDIDDVGPVNRWWLELMRVKPHKVEDFLFSNDVPTEVIPDKTTLYINGGAPYDLDEIVHNVTYPDGRKQRAPYIDLSYEIVEDPNGIFKIEGRRLVTTGNGTGKVKSIFRGVETYFDVIANNNTNNYVDDFSDDKFLKDISTVGTWIVEDGKLKNVNSKNEKQYVVNHSQFLKDNFKIDFDLTMLGSGISADAGANGGILLGAQGDKNKEFYTILFGSGYYKKIYSNDEYRNPTCEGYIMGDLDDGGPYHVTVIKNGDWMVALVDGKLVGSLEVGNDFDGNFGFFTYTNNIEIDNLSVMPYDAGTAPEVQTFNLSFERSDITELNVNVDNPLKEDVIYKFYRNGVWTYDSKEPNFFDHTLQDEENEYDYTVYAINEKGEVLAKGEGNSNLNEIPDTMFYIDNIRYRNGENGTFNESVYFANNKGMDTTGIEGIWFDQYYKFTTLPKIFYDQAYIRTNRYFGKWIYNSADGGDEWMKFDIHNYSATVYVVFFTAEDTPNWIYNQNWQLTHHQMDVNSAGETNPTIFITTTNSVYKKKFSCKKGEKTTITLGAQSDTTEYHYFVIVVPDRG